MASYTITGSDGKDYTVQGPEGVDEAVLKQAVESKIRRNLADEARTKEIAKLEAEIEQRKLKALENRKIASEKSDYNPGLMEWDDDLIASFGRGFKSVGETGFL